MLNIPSILRWIAPLPAFFNSLTGDWHKWNKEKKRLHAVASAVSHFSNLCIAWAILFFALPQVQQKPEQVVRVEKTPDQSTIAKAKQRSPRKQQTLLKHDIEETSIVSPTQQSTPIADAKARDQNLLPEVPAAAAAPTQNAFAPQPIQVATADFGHLTDFATVVITRKKPE